MPPKDIVDTRPHEATVELATPSLSDTIAAPAESDATANGATLDEPPPAIDALPEGSFDASIERAAAPTAAAHDPSDFQPVRLLGQGGMGRVILATQRSLRRRVAIKTTQQKGVSPSAIVREGVITGMLEHPNIPPVHALLRDVNGQPVLVMKHIEGVSWASVIADPDHPLRAQSPLFDGASELDAHLEVLVQLCNAVEFAHSRSIIHRDIKPDNVMLGRYGEVYLIDWGIAFNAAWHSNATPIQLIGTATHMAPEMVACELPDPRTDVYLLGATLHQLLVGRPPHQAATLDASIAHAFESAPFDYDASVPPELADLCRRSLARLRDDRPPSARAFRESLRSYRAHGASIELCASADGRLDALTKALAEPAHDAVAIAMLEHECRFGYGQALESWPDNTRAREGLSRTCAALCAHEIKLENLHRAQALLAEVTAQTASRAALEQATRALNDRLRERGARAERERAEAEARDARRSSRERAIVLGTIGAYGIAVTAWRRLYPVSELDVPARQRSLLVVWLILGVVMAVAITAVWKRFAESTLNRQLLGLAAAIGAIVLVNRSIGIVTTPGAAVTLSADMMVASAFTAAIAVFVHRAFALATIIQLAAVVLLCAFPQKNGLIFNVALVLVLAAYAAIFRRISAPAAHATIERADHSSAS